MRFLIGCITCFLVMFFKEALNKYSIRKRAIERNLAIFNYESSSFEWINKDAQYVFDGSKEVKKNGRVNIFTINGKKK